MPLGPRRYLKTTPMRKASLLLYADSERSTDMLYFGKFHAPDPFIAMEVEGRKIAVLNALEIGRGNKEGSFDEILPLEACTEEAQKEFPKAPNATTAVIAWIAKELKQKRFIIPEEFPSGLATRLSQMGLKLEVAEGPLFPERELKTRKEVEAIQEGNRCAALGLAAAEKILRESTIEDGALFYGGLALTSEKLKFAIEVSCLEAGALSSGTIVAGGDQACDPHCRGSGPLHANELIIIDVFPRVQATGYHGDMTRTFLKGKASEAQHKLVAAVRAAQLGALKKIRAGVNGREVHRGVEAEFEARGFLTERGSAGAKGFFHGTGHGLGLAIHETPRLSGAVDSTLQRGAVVTVEPGLYYPGLGACRIEDVVQVTATKPKLLSDYGYDWELA